MKKNIIQNIIIVVLVILTIIIVFFAGYLYDGHTREYSEVSTPNEALMRLMNGNFMYLKSQKNKASISLKRRISTSENGQHPFAVIITCSDSRVSPEHIFSEGIGELFVVRTAGNILSDFDLISVEYGVLHLGAKAIIIMGHNSCGAIEAAFHDSHPDDYLTPLIDEIKPVIKGATTLEEATVLNINNGFFKLLDNDKYIQLINEKKLIIAKAGYDIKTGEVVFFN